MKSYKRHLIFKEQNIGLFKLLYHLSNFLMKLGTINWILNGVSISIIALLVGVNIGKYSDVMDSRLEGKTEKEIKEIFKVFEITKSKQ